jgi:hypothetical protein
MIRVCFDKEKLQVSLTFDSELDLAQFTDNRIEYTILPALNGLRVAVREAQTKSVESYAEHLWRKR